MVGDIYHYQSEDAGKYEIAGRKGHLTIRAMNRNIEGLHLTGPYGEEGYVNKEGKPIQQGDSDKLIFLNAHFLHFTHLKRSSKDDHHKYKYDLGIKSDKGLPEVFSLDKPAGIPLLCQGRSKLYEVLSFGKKLLKHD